MLLRSLSIVLQYIQLFWLYSYLLYDGYLGSISVFAWCYALEFPCAGCFSTVCNKIFIRVVYFNNTIPVYCMLFVFTIFFSELEHV